MNPQPDLMERLMAVSSGLARRFPDHNGPFEIMTRLLEECGELAASIENSYQRLKAEGFIE